MSTDDGLDAKAVIEQFQGSQQTLEQLREKLRAVMLAEEGAARAATSIDAASQAIVNVATALDAAIGEIQAVRSATVDALAAAQQFLSGTDLGALREEIGALAAENRSGITQLQDDVRELAERIPQAEQLRAELESVKQQIPARTRKKLGI